MRDDLSIEEYGEAFMTLSDEQKRGVYEDAHRENERLRAANAELLEALAPFADVDGEGEGDFADDTPVTVKMGRSIFYALVLGDFRRARRIHDKHEGTE